MTAEATLSLSVGVIEDEPRLRELLVREIAAMGHAASGFPTAEQAWPHINKDLDAVILDLNLPGMAGMELFRRIRSERSEVAVVILTGFGSFDSAVQSLRLQAEDYLTKPCSLADIDRALSRVLARKREKDRHARLSEPQEDPIKPGDARAVPSADAFDSATLADLERSRILQAIEKHNGNKPAVAAELGISLRTLYNRINLYRHEGFEV